MTILELLQSQHVCFIQGSRCRLRCNKNHFFVHRRKGTREVYASIVYEGLDEKKAVDAFLKYEEKAHE